MTNTNGSTDRSSQEETQGLRCIVALALALIHGARLAASRLGRVGSSTHTMAGLRDESLRLFFWDVTTQHRCRHHPLVFNFRHSFLLWVSTPLIIFIFRDLRCCPNHPRTRPLVILSSSRLSGPRLSCARWGMFHVAG